MKKIFAAVFAFISAFLTGSLQASAVGATPLAGDNDWWIYLILAIIAVAMIAVLVITGKKKK